MIKAVECRCALAGQTRVVVYAVLDFFAPLFASRQKVEER
jgi:hypothetical protein